MSITKQFIVMYTYKNYSFISEETVTQAPTTEATGSVKLYVIETYDMHFDLAFNLVSLLIISLFILSLRRCVEGLSLAKRPM